jgi:hypothetical protein
MASNHYLTFLNTKDFVKFAIHKSLGKQHNDKDNPAGWFCKRI